MRSEEFMNAEEVARYLHLGKNTVYQLAKTGKIASYHVGRKLKFTLEDVEAYVASTHRTHLHAAPPSAKSPAANALDGHQADDSRSLVEAASFGAVSNDPFTVAGADEVADTIASALNMEGMPASRLMLGSYTSLVNLYAGEADAAVVNLYDQATNSWNTSYVRNLAPGASVVIIRLLGRRQGLIVQEGNPKGLSTWGGLLRDGVRLANRQKGSGPRVLLDEKLRALEARCETIEGYGPQTYAGATAIRRVANGISDVTVGSEREAQHVPGVQFVPLQPEWVDVVVAKTPRTRPLVRKLNEILATERVRRDFEALAPGDASKLGVVVYES